MIISASRRTDIPAFYADWMMNRIRAGSVMVRNPVVLDQVYKIDLSPANIDGIVFWTKNPAPMLEHVAELEDRSYIFYFQITLNGYGTKLEPNVPAVEELVETFKKLSYKLQQQECSVLDTCRTIWRYDPIVFTDEFTYDWHIANFTKLCKELRGWTDKCVISFLDVYDRVKFNLDRFDVKFQIVDDNIKISLAKEMVRIATGKFKIDTIKIESCAELLNTVDIGVEHGSCIDGNLFLKLHKNAGSIRNPSTFKTYFHKDKYQRQACGCVASVDVGGFNTCRHGCFYCYANCKPEIIERSKALHDPNSPLIMGNVGEHDTIIERKALNCIIKERNF